MAKFTDLPEWSSLSKEERLTLRATYDPKEYRNLLGEKSFSKKDADKAAKFHESIQKEVK